MLNSTKLIRRVDDLGRVVIPKDIRCALGIHEGDGLEICINGNSVMLRKEASDMTAERAIELLSSGTRMPTVPHSTEELDYACRMACDALQTQLAADMDNSDLLAEIVLEIEALRADAKRTWCAKDADRYDARGRERKRPVVSG